LQFSDLAYGIIFNFKYPVSCGGLYIESISNQKLVVRELNGGTSNVAFDYFVNGVQQGYENQEVIREKTNN